MEMIRVTTNL